LKKGSTLYECANKARTKGGEQSSVVVCYGEQQARSSLQSCRAVLVATCHFLEKLGESCTHGMKNIFLDFVSMLASVKPSILSSRAGVACVVFADGLLTETIAQEETRTDASCWHSSSNKSSRLAPFKDIPFRSLFDPNNLSLFASLSPASVVQGFMKKPSSSLTSLLHSQLWKFYSGKVAASFTYC
jgi:hypothetical protein